jgi:hypothetical protein
LFRNNRYFLAQLRKTTSILTCRSKSTPPRNKLRKWAFKMPDIEKMMQESAAEDIQPAGGCGETK